MTRFIGDRVEMIEQDGVPLRFTWRSRHHQVRTIQEHHRYNLKWWEGGEKHIRRDYYLVWTQTKLLAMLYRDLATGNWILHSIVD